MWRENVFHSIDTFREVSSLEIEQDENRCLISPISCCSSSGQLAIVHGTSLIILSPGGDAELEVQAELEFERPLEAVCWAPGQPLVIAGDDSGMLHFITASGMLVFSKRLAQGHQGGPVFRSIQFDSHSCSAFLLAVLCSGRVLGVINLPIAALASMNDLSDAAELASHAKNVQLLQCSLPSTNPSTVVIVPPTAADSKSFKVLVIDSKGSASVIELGSRPSGEAGWSFHMTDPSAARAAPFLRGVDCSAAISLAHYTDCKDIASPALMSLVLVLATDGRLILADTASGAVMAALPSTPKRGHRTNILSLLRVPTQSTPENAMFLVGLGSESSRNTAQEVLLVIERCDSFPDTSLPLSCLLLPLCLSGLRPVASCDTNRGSVLWPVGYNTTAMCSSFVLSSSEGTNELRAYTHADDVITAVTALVTGLSAVTNKGAAIAPENIAEASVDISFVIGCILGHAQNTARHRVEGFDKIQFSANLCSLLLNLPVSTKLSDVLSLARCVLCYYQNPPAHFIDQFLQKSESALERLDGKSDSTVQQFQDILKKLNHFIAFTFTARNYVVSWNPSNYVQLNCSKEDSEEERVRSVVSELIYSMDRDPFGDTSHDWNYHVWRSCVVSFNLIESNIIIERHFGGTWPILARDQFIALLSKMCIIQEREKNDPELLIAPDDLIEWLDGTLIPELYAQRNIHCIEICCEYLRAQALSLEFAFGAPFEPALLTILAVKTAEKYCPQLLTRKPSQIPFKRYGSDDSGKGIATITLCNLHNTLALQGAVWRTWDARPTCLDVINHGLDGLVRNRLLDLVTEPNITKTALSDEEYTAIVVDDIGNVIRPLVDQFRGSLDAMILVWINNILGNTFIVYSPVQAAVKLSTDKSVVVILYSRLVAITSAIKDPDLLASAVLTLWQMSTSSNAGSLGVDADAEADAALAHSLQRLAKIGLDVFPRVSSGRNKDALQESIRLLRLKAIAASYGISNFDVRNTRQLRGVVNIIATSYWVDRSITDCIEFAEAWNSISIDLPYILGRALIARVLVRERLSTSSDQIYDDVHPLEVLDKTKLLEDAFRSIPDHRQALATETAVSYLIDNLEDICAKISRGNASGAEITTLKEEASMACSGAVTLGHLLLDGLGSVRDAPKWAGFITTGLLSALKRIRFLQSDYNIYLSVSGLADPIVCLDVGRRLAENRTKDLIARRESGIASSNMHNGDKKISERRKDLHKISSNSTDSDLLSNYFMLPAKTRHACMLMNVSPVFVEYNVISLLTKEGKQAIALEVAKMLSFENIMDAKFSSDGSDDSSMTASTNAQLVLDAAIALCTLVARQVLSTVSASSKVDIAVVETFLLARSILQISSVTCNPEYLGGTLDLFSGCDLVVSVYDRFEAPANAAKAVKGKIASNTTSNVGTFQVSQHVSFSRDGILMSPDIALALLLKHVLKEVQRRGLTSVGAKSVNNSAADRGSSLYLEDFVNFLQKSENHILAVRSLLSSWCMFDGKAKALQISLLGLSRKILSYRDIDSCLGVACLASVSYDTMVRELKQAVPSIQSDFSRLQTVAVIGEDLSRLWSQEELLGVFQSLQTNAKWWHTLASHGIKIDPRAFQSSIASQREACIRAVVPELLSKSSLNLDLAIEYCCQFDVEGSYATLCYIEQLLLGSSISPSELHWMKLVNQASSTVGEAALAGLYRRILKKINPLDYEKIRFVSLWLIQAISEDPSLQDNIKDELPDVAMCRYNRYVDIITFLAGVSFQLSGADLTPAYVSVYENLSASSPYQHRLPLWMLVDDTWGVLGPIMSSVPELCPKLTLLCGPLAINPDIFHSKRVMASTSLFPRVASSEVTASCNNISKKSNEVDMAITSGRVLAVERLKDFQDNIQCIEDHRLRIEIWQWAYRREKESKNWFVAEIILGAALDDTGNLRKFHAADNTLILNNLKELRGEMLLDMVRLKCRRVLISLVDEKRRDSDADLSVQAIDEMVYGLSLSEANNMDRILRHLLEWAIEISWEMQLFRMQGNTASGNSRGSATSSALCIWDITITRFFPAVLTFFNRVAAAAKKMMPYCAKLDKHIKGDGVEEDKSASSLEAIRHFFITKLLADGLTAYPLSEKGSSLASAVSEETSSDATSGKSAKSNSAAGWAGLLGVSESLVSPTAAASRRRGDLFCAFSIAVLVGCCSSLDQRKLYYDQLQTLAKSNGKSGKARRFTSRSKFRAIQALRFFPSCENVVFNSNDNNNIISYVWTPEDNDLWRFLFCISELQELRLPCSEETLGESIGVSLTDHQPIITPSGMPGIHDPRLLIRTLLRDEGHQTEVSELCRDILLCSMSSQTGHDIWIDLIVHMEMNGHHRCLLDTMLILRHYQGSEIRGPLCNDAVGSIAISLSEVCGGDLACALVRVLNIFTVECAEKIEQVIMLLRNRNKVDTSELHSKKNQSTVASTVSECSLALNKGRVVLRNVVEGCAWGISEWEEAPEDLILCLEHLSVLWAMLSKYCASSAFDQLKHSEEPSAQISGDVGGCTRNLLVSSFKIIIGAAFDWLNFNFGTARDVTTKINFSSLLDICLRKRMGFAAAAVYSRIMQSCLSCMSSCLHTLTKICCGFQTDYLGGTVIRRTDAVASEVLKMAFDHIARNVMCPISAIDSVAVITEHSNIFSWIQIDDSIHWPWMLIGAGFRTLSSGSVFSFLDERCILPENVEFLRVLLSAAANSWWQTVSTVDTPVSRSSCNSTTTKDSQALLQWCLSSRGRQLLLSKAFPCIEAAAKFRLLLAVEASQSKLLQSTEVDRAMLTKILNMLHAT